MKKYTFLFVFSALMLLHTGLMAQYSISATTGIHYSNVKTPGINMGVLDYKAITGWSAGVLVNHDLSPALSIGSGILYSEEGFALREGTQVDVFGLNIPVGVSARTEVRSIKAPLRLQYHFGRGEGVHPYLAGGFNISYAESAQLVTRAESIFDFQLATIDIDMGGNAFNRWGIESQIAGGLKINSGDSFYFAELGFSHDLNDLTDTASTVIDIGLKNYNIGMSVGYGIRF